MQKNRFVIFFLLVLALHSCYYDKENELYGMQTACNSGNVTFSATVAPLLSQQGCVSCHSGSNPSGNVNLQGYANIRAAAGGGRLFGTVNHSPGFSPMPKGGSKMAPCDISKLKAWIDAGMPNN